MLIATGVMTCASMAPAMAANPAPDDANKGWNLSVNGAITAGTEVQPGDYVDFNGDQNVSVSKDVKDGVKIVKVELNKDIDVNSVPTNALNSKYNLSVGTANENGTMPFFVNSNGAFYAANGKLVVDKDGNVTAGNVVLNNGVFIGSSALRDGELFVGDASGSYSQITPKSAKLGQVTIDEKGNIAGVNSIQTNALNAKYNLSVGTANENGTMPFFVNSNGAFYAANGKLVVDKDGNVTAGNVVLNNGVFIGSSALRDGELFVGDASGSYSQITPKSAKLGQVTIDEKGNIAGVNSIQTNALNAKYNLSVGTANENGTMPFFVNSNGAFYAANGKLVVDKDGKLVAPEAELGKVTADEGVIGNVVLKDGVFYKHTALRDGELFLGDADGNYSQITTKGAKLGKVTVAEDGKITGVAAGVADTDAVNVGQLKEAVEAGNTDTHIKPGEYGVGADNTVKMDVVDKNGNKVDTVTIKDVAKASDVGDVNNIANDIKNKEGKTTVVDAVNNLNNKVGDLQYSKVEKGDIADGDSTTTAIGKLDQKLTDVAATAAKHTKVEGSKNIIVENTAKEGEAANYQVKLNNIIDLGDKGSVTTGNTVMNSDGVKVGTDVSLNKDGLNVGKDVSVTATAVTAGKTSISDEGVKVGDKTYISDKGLNANGQNITNVADGKVEKDSKDAINGGQLHQAKADINNRIDGVENQVVSNTNRINQLGSRVNKVGAGAAALAALHPMDFDPDDKLTFSAGYGNYGGENAAAIGAYYRPDEKVMFSVGGTVGNGENMVNAGVSFSLDRTNHVSNSRTAMAREILDLRAEVTELKAMVAKGGLGSIAEDKMKIFPDVAENHWAYEYVGKLAAAGIIEGYPDGKFSGDRMMSRYEFAAMLYRAMQKGAQLDSKIINEFAPEMGRIRVDRISGEDGDRDKIERVRVNAVKGERDHYGNKLAK